MTHHIKSQSRHQSTLFPEVIDNFVTEVISKLNQWSVRHPFLMIGLWLLVTALSAISLTDLKMNPTTDAWLKEGNTRLDRLAELKERFDSGKNLIIMVSTKGNDIFTMEGLEALREVHAGVEQIEGAMRVDSLVNFPFSSADGDDLLVEELLGRYRPLDAGLTAELRKRAFADERLGHRLVTVDGYL